MKRKKIFLRYRRATEGEGQCTDCRHSLECGTIWWPQLRCQTGSVVMPVVDRSGTCDGWEKKTDTTEHYYLCR